MVGSDLVPKLGGLRFTAPISVMLTPLGEPLALCKATCAAVNVLRVVREEVPEAGSLGLASPHGVLILRGHGRSTILNIKVGRGPIGRGLGTNNWFNS